MFQFIIYIIKMAINSSETFWTKPRGYMPDGPG